MPQAPDLLASIHHDGSEKYVVAKARNQGTVALGDQVTIRLRAHPDLEIERVFLRTLPDGEQHLNPMRRNEDAAKKTCVWWQVTVKVTMPQFHYRFLILTSDGVFWFNGEGLCRYTPTDAGDFRLLAGYTPPSWLPGATFYQIFPDRFANGDSGLTVESGEFTAYGATAVRRRWGGSPTAKGRKAMVEFFGGDLIGIRKRLDYLEELGVKAIYLNPIFSSHSNHKYDVIDFRTVDPHLGGNRALTDLRREAAEREIRLILDIMPNHCGAQHGWFVRAQADPEAAEASYFTFRNHPQDYCTWMGIDELPKLNYRSRALREEMFAGHNSIFRQWLRPPYSISGYRIDVANMMARQGETQLNIEVASGIREAVKAENPDAYLVGENFFDAGNQLQGDCWDAVMNYAGFTFPLWQWLRGMEWAQLFKPGFIAGSGRLPTAALVRTWSAFRAGIPWVIAQQQFNLLGSHDTRRILSTVNEDAALNRIAIVLLMTYPGVPSVYYGDEIGLTGQTDNLARGCMIWERERWDSNLWDFYRQLIALRRRSNALQVGGFQVVLCEEDALAFVRESHQEVVLVAANRGETTRAESDLPVWHAALPDGLELTEHFSKRRSVVESGKLRLPAMPTGATLWHATF